MADFGALWEIALPYDRFVAESEHHRGLWEGIYKLMRVPDWAYQAVPPGTRRRLLVIAEDWCGDASSTIPVVARFADAVPGVELRILRRDEHPELMDRYLTNGARSIPIVIALLQSVSTPGINVVGMTVLLQFVISFGYILVVNAPQNMVGFGTGTFQARDFVRTGVALTLIGYALLYVFGLTYWHWLGYV